ncbi:MAG: hypothetical protein NTX50_19790 [Candidatus Sumerlaeota bacterium]|nr:hypothetical protein [Candidatus Sumerlaeota bacterium]
MLVMLFLLHDIIHHLLLIFMGFGEGAISILPMCESWKNIAVLDPGCRACFQIPNEVSKSDSGMQIKEKMKMIFCSVHAIENAPFVFEGTLHVTKQRLAIISVQDRVTILC